MTKTAKRTFSIKFTQPTLTQQHAKDEVDINNIMARYVKTGVIDHVAKYKPQYTENSEADYHTSMNIVARADQMFGELPAAARKRFNNDPAEFLSFVNDEANHDQLAGLGLTNNPPNPTTTPATDPAPANPGNPSPVQPANTSSEPAPASPDTAV